MATRKVTLSASVPGSVLAAPIQPQGGAPVLEYPDPHGVTWETAGATLTWDDEGWPDWEIVVVVAGGTVATKTIGSTGTTVSANDLVSASADQSGNKPAVPGQGGGGEATNIITLGPTDTVPSGTKPGTIIVRTQA